MTAIVDGRDGDAHFIRTVDWTAWAASTTIIPHSRAQPNWRRSARHGEEGRGGYRDRQDENGPCRQTRRQTRRQSQGSAELNVPADLQGFVERFGGVFEHSPWVAERAWSRRPFDSVLHLHAAMLRVVAEADPAEQLALLCAHPELAGMQAMQGSLTAESSGEQGRLGFTALAQEEFARIAEINRRYRQKFGFPCIVALRLHAARDSVMKEMERRLAHDAQTELRIALEQVGHITRGRLATLLGGE